MSKWRNNTTEKYLVLGLLSLLLAVWMQFLFYTPHAHEAQQKKIEKHVAKQLSLLQTSGDYLSDVLKEHSLTWLWKNNQEAVNYFSQHNIHLFVTRNDSLLFWTSNLVSGQSLLNDIPVKRKLVKFNNAWCLKHVIHQENFTIYSLYPVKYEFRISNEVIQDRFTNLDILDKTEILPYKDKENVNISSGGEFLFGLKFSGNGKGNVLYRNLSILLYNLALFCFILWFYFHISTEINKRKRFMWESGMLLLFIGTLFSLYFFRIPKVFYELELFSPRIMAISTFFHSLGILLYCALFWLVISFVAFRHNPFLVNRFSSSKKFIAIFFLLGTFVLVSHLFLEVIDNSVINFEIYRLNEADIYSFIVYGAFLAFYGGWALWLGGLLQQMVKQDAKEVGRQLHFIAFLLLIALILLKQFELTYATFSGYLIIYFTYYLYHKKQVKINFLHLFLYTFIFANMWVLFVWTRANAIEMDKQQTALINVSEGWFSERDRYAEIILLRMAPQMKRDNQLKSLVCAQNPDPIAVKVYLDEHYFTGQWKKYDIEVVICWPDADLVIETTGERTACYPYFYSMVEENCERLGETDFFYQNDKNGRISYLGWFVFNQYQPMETSLFLDIQSNPLSKGVGYPELLIDNLSSGHVSNTSTYDFARYYDHQLVTYTGEFRYNTLADWIPDFDGEFNRFKNDNYNHLVYRYGEDDLIVLSSKVRNWYDYILLLTYVYLFVFGAISIGLIIYLFIYQRTIINRTFAGRIRLVILSVVLFAFIMVGNTSIFFNLRQAKQKQYATIRDKSRSVMMFLDQYIGELPTLEGVDQSYLMDLLQNISNGLSLDVNLYSLDGNLLSSSRPLIFNYNIIGKRMSAEAFKLLHYNNTNMVIVNEQFGNLKYLAAYFMIYNWENELIGYVNVPFFISSDQLASETSTFIVVMINIYLFFVLAALFITVILIRNLTKPLRVIQDKLSGIRLERKNEMIAYEQNDEIGDLVKEYNRMVEELTRSAEQLAVNQRKLAWREMARQIAHEIKNPLTPMKLNLQLLQRAKANGSDNFDAILSKTTQTIIEQIDNLSRIATEFSDFAKMPEAKPERINIVQPLNDAVQLFKHSTYVEIHLHAEKAQKICIFADRKQMLQVFNNLIKNAIQAIPHNQKGTINIFIEEGEENVTVEIKDNGKGMDKDIQERLFEPSFTTKSSGMGLGLSIVKNIVLLANGDVWFDTDDSGTSFYVQLPKFLNDEEQR